MAGIGPLLAAAVMVTSALCLSYDAYPASHPTADVKDIRPVRVLHPSGSGGRTLGEMALRAGLRKQRDPAGTMPCQSFCDWTYSAHSRNKSNVEDKTGRYSCQQAAHSCETMDEWYRKTGYNFASTEMLLPESTPGGKLCSQFQYLVALRHPLARIASEASKHQDDITNFYAQMVSPDGYWLAKRGSALRTTAAVSNYYIRALLGESVFFLPVDGITAEHLEQAKEVLKQMTVIPLDLLDTTYAHDVLRKIPAFSGISDYRQSHVHTGIQNGTKPTLEQTLAKLGLKKDVLRRNNRFDLELYEWTLRRFLESAGEMQSPADGSRVPPPPPPPPSRVT